MTSHHSALIPLEPRCYENPLLVYLRRVGCKSGLKTTERTFLPSDEVLYNHVCHILAVGVSVLVQSVGCGEAELVHDDRPVLCPHRLSPTHRYQSLLCT